MSPIVYWEKTLEPMSCRCWYSVYLKSKETRKPARLTAMRAQLTIAKRATTAMSIQLTGSSKLLLPSATRSIPAINAMGIEASKILATRNSVTPPTSRPLYFLTKRPNRSIDLNTYELSNLFGVKYKNC